jgi:hypothetical protein
MKIGATSRVKGDDFTHTYQEDISRQDLELPYLDGGSTPPRLDEDTPAVVAMVAGPAKPQKGGIEPLYRQNAPPVLFG